MTATNPALTDGIIPAGTTSLEITFSENVLGAFLPANYSLRNQGPDGILGNGDDVFVAIIDDSGSEPPGGSSTVTLQFVAGLAEGVYRLVLRDTIVDDNNQALDGDGNGAAGGDFVRDFVVGVPGTYLTAPSGFVFDPQFTGFGAGQLVQGTGDTFDGTNRLQVGGVDFVGPFQAAPLLSDGGRTVSTLMAVLADLEIHREITVPDVGSENFARTVDVFHNPTLAPIATTVTLVGNLGGTGGATVFDTADGDTVVETTDRWIGTVGSGGVALLHYLYGPHPASLVPTSVQVLNDNIVWNYALTVQPGESVRLAHFTIVGATQQQAVAAAAVLVQPTAFGGQAGAFLTQDERDSLANFVYNQPPTLTVASGAVVVAEASPATNTGTYADVDLGDDVTLSVFSGPGSVSKTGTNSGTWTWSHTPADGPAGPTTITIRADDGVNPPVDITFTLTVNNVPPTVTRNLANVTVNEGSPAANSGTFGDVGADTVVVTSSIGTITQGAGTWNWSFTPADGNGQPQTVTITATDSDGAQTTTTFTLTVLNVPPTVALLGGNTVDEGAGHRLVFQVSDPGLDTISSFAVLWGDGTMSQFQGAAHGRMVEHVYRNEGTYTITAGVVDEDGAYPNIATRTVTVRNVASFLAATADIGIQTDLDGNGLVGAGDTVTYSILVANTGPDPATNVQVASLLDPNLQHVAGYTRLFPNAFQSAGTRVDAGISRIGVYRNGLWLFDTNGNGVQDAGDAATFFGGTGVETSAGYIGDLPVVGDWNGDGFDEIGIYRDGAWLLDRNGDGVFGFGDSVALFGAPGDRPVVGDWNGDGIDDLGVWRQGWWLLDAYPDHAFGFGDVAVPYGAATDRPVVGDWDGDGRDDIGVFRDGQWLNDANHNFAFDAGDFAAAFGRGPTRTLLGDTPTPGDWNGDGRDDVGIHRQDIWRIDSDANGFEGGTDRTSTFGLSTDIPVVGNWANSMAPTPISVGTLLPGQVARIELRARVLPTTPPGTVLTSRFFVSGTDSGTGVPFNTTMVTVSQPLNLPPLPVVGGPQATATIQRLGSAPGMEVVRILFANEGGGILPASVLTLQLPPGVALNLSGGNPGWTQTGPTTFRLAVGPLSARQSGYFDILLIFDPLNPPPLPLNLIATLTLS